MTTDGTDPLITTHAYTVGPYAFRSRLPRVGTSADQTQWFATAHGAPIPGSYATLEDAMHAALATGEKA